MPQSKCRFCSLPLEHTFADLGLSPLSNSYLKPQALPEKEPFFPLHAFVCSGCLLVQLEEFESPEAIFSDYAYFSSFSESWLDHCKRYAADMTSRFGFNSASHVVEIASNDGYLLQFFKDKGVPVLGVEPAKNVADVAIEKGIPTEKKFFGTQTASELASQGKKADLLLGNNVLAHVPDLNDFVAGMKVLLKDDGVLTMEFPHLLKLIDENQFDTIYHEHFSYFSFFVVEKVFAKHGLTLFDVEEHPTHGGSLRIFGRHQEDSSKPVSSAVGALKEKEQQAGLDRLETYLTFGKKVEKVKADLLAFFAQAKSQNKKVVGYGAPAKGNTLLNYCQVGTDSISYTVDRSPHKQNHLLPGSRIPIHAPEKIKETRPDFVLILPWNLKTEIVPQLDFIQEWGGRCVVPIPAVQVI